MLTVVFLPLGDGLKQRKPSDKPSVIPMANLRPASFSMGYAHGLSKHKPYVAWSTELASLAQTETGLPSAEVLA